ncbi:peptidoglycan-binding protein [Streptomyces sp. NBC_01613]|uniref:peptidoglycan-binding domain-containing protein n=1 Tax=Streptomyces sp. NBC_01613 TaxID=2975896 RepID=UPI00386601E7
MSEPAGSNCPECGKPRAADGTPTCSCARRASDIHRETRTAEAAAAEDFDPVRIRPFVEIDVNSASLEAAAAKNEAGRTHPAETVGVSKDAEESQQPDNSGELGGDGPTPADEDGPVPSSLDELPPQLPPDDAPNRRRPARVLLAIAAGAAVAVLVTGGIIGGFFWYDSPSRNESVSGGLRAGLPEERPSGNHPSSGDPSRTASPAQSSATSTSSPSTTSSGTQVSAPGANGPSGNAPSATATATGAPAPSESGGRAPALRYGDKGPEVVELQLRLRQVGYYDGGADGDYDRQVESAVRGYQFTRVILQDESGVYGTATRASLESETTEP